jgi:putative oxidoreductase
MISPRTNPEIAKIDSRAAPCAALLLRDSLGTLLLGHAGLKLFVFTPAGTAKFFGSAGLPPGLAYVVMTAEVVGGIALILGLWTCAVAIARVPILLGAIFTVHGAAGFFLTNAHRGWEYPAFWIFALMVQALLGDGIHALRWPRTIGLGSGLTGAHFH